MHPLPPDRFLAVKGTGDSP